MALDKETQELFEDVRVKLGIGIRKVELTDDTMCRLLKYAVGDYAQYVQSFVIENNWATLYGKNLTNTDIAFALSVRTLDMAKDYSYYFSKEVGLQNGGAWELKKDFIKTGQVEDMVLVCLITMSMIDL